MMLFKNTDMKLKKIGFVKTYESDVVIEYERDDDTYSYTHVLSFISKNSGNHILVSSQKNLNEDGLVNAVGLTKKELKLCYKKMKELWG